MPTATLRSCIRITLLALGLVTAVTAPAAAQDVFGGVFDFLWSGGTRAVVSFPASFQPRQLIVSFGDRKLYWIDKRGEAISYPIAVPNEKARWSGATTIADKKVNPVWTPTADMRRQNPKLPASMPGGHPLNPLGVRALYLGGTMYRIHGTDAPWLIGQPVSHGCIRMYNEDVLDLYPRVPLGTRVTVTWQHFTG